MPTLAPKLTHLVLNTAAGGTMERPSELVLRAMANLTKLSAELPGMPALRCEFSGATCWTVYHGNAPVTTCAVVMESRRAASSWRLLEQAYLKASDGEIEGLTGGAYCEMPEQVPWVGTIVWPEAVRFVSEMSWISQYNLHRAWLLIDAFNADSAAAGEAEASG